MLKAGPGRPAGRGISLSVSAYSTRAVVFHPGRSPKHPIQMLLCRNSFPQDVEKLGASGFGAEWTGSCMYPMLGFPPGNLTGSLSKSGLFDSFGEI
jgi:hypothetical protein